MTWKLYLVNCAGFFTQLFPSIVLTLLPFEESSFRLRRRYVYIAAFVFSVLASAAFPYVMGLPIEAWFKDMPRFGNVYMLVICLVYLVAYICLIRIQAVKKSLTMCFVIFYAASVYLIVNLIMPQTSDTIYNTVYLPEQLFLFVVVTALLFPTAALLLVRVMRPYLKEIEQETLKHGFHVIIGVSVLAFATMFVFTTLLPIEDRSFYYVLCPSFLLVAATMTAFYWLMLKESIRRKRESEYLRYKKIQDIQYTKLQREIENDARIRHDVRHHYRVLYEMALASKDEEAQVYLSHLLEQVTQRETAQYCQNKTINALMQYYIGWAKDEEIDCRVQAVCGELAVSPVDLSTILGNILENAIHACQKLSGERWIRVKLGIVGSAFAVQVENSCGGVRLQSGYTPGALLPAEAFVSGSGSGGYGLKNISLAAQRYGGEAQFLYDEAAGIFTTRVRLNPQVPQ